MIKGIFYNNISQCEGLGDNFPVMMSFLKENGIKGIHFDYSELENAPEKLIDCLAECEISVLCIHVVCHLMSKNDALFYTALDQCNKAIAMAKQLCCKRVMVVPAYTDDINGFEDKERAVNRMIEGLRRIVNEAERNEIDIFIENFSSTLLPFSTPKEILRLLREVPGVHYAFDTANFVCVECDTEVAYKQLGNFAEMAHIKDFGYVNQDGFLCDNGKRVYGVKYGTGLAKLNEVMPMLLAEHPDIPYIIEAHSKVQKQHIKEICEYLDNFDRR